MVSYNDYKTAHNAFLLRIQQSSDEIFAFVQDEIKFLEGEAERHRVRANTEATRGAELEAAVGAFLAYCSEDSLNDSGPIADIVKAIEPLRDWRKLDAQR